MRYVEVAVPLPIAGSLTYALAQGQHPRPGCRVRVRVGKRKLVGMVVRPVEVPPDGIEIRPVDRVVDSSPILDRSLLDLAEFISSYYLAPIGEVFQSMLPADLPPAGDRRVWLTDAGALSDPRDDVETAIVELIRERGPLAIGDLERKIDRPDCGATLARLIEHGRIAASEGSRSGSRFATAVELRSKDLQKLLDRCGRSRPGREVVEYLAALGRPATVRETLAAVGCSRGVITRLVKLGVLRQFSQLTRLDLGHHVVQRQHGTEFELNRGQTRSLETILETLDEGTFRGFLLRGLTGSGKTEVYLRAIAKALDQGRSAVVLVPEIALVPVLASTVRQRFDDRLAILHSGLGRAERQQEWERIRRGEARVVLGPRSAVFAPVRSLGLVVVDEEQDTAYKQETTPRYHARDLALYRGRAERAAVVLVSATPSLESRANVEWQKLAPLVLSERVAGGSLPEGILVDLREEKPRRPGEVYFSPRLMAELERTVANGDQAIVLRNRRGYSPLLLCRACGDDSRCDECGLPRTFHRRFSELLCHYCGSRRPVPDRCEACGEEALEPVGTGTERVEEELRERLPGAAIDTLDRDTLRRHGRVVAVLERFGRGDTQILVGTQMVSKGHHFPRVALAAVLQADTYLGFPDFRAVERTYSLLTQLAGRAGRGSTPGKVVIQTFHPEHYAIQAALTHDDERFADEEMRFRRIFHYPPFTRMVQILLQQTNRGVAEQKAEMLGHQLERHPLATGVRILGPAPAPFEKLRGKWRFQLLLRGTSGASVRRLVREVLAKHPESKALVDVDPLELL